MWESLDSQVVCAPFFDFAQLGTLQALASDGYYKWNGHKYEKQPVFDFSDGAPDQFVFDANMDGLPDPAVDDRYLGKYSLIVAVNQGDGDFLKSNVSSEFSGSGSIYYIHMDINNDGLMERFYSGHDGTRGFCRTDMNEGLVKIDYMDLGDQSKNMDFCLDVCADFDRDGRLDILCTARSESGRPYWVILFNEGNGRWTVKPILQTNEPLSDMVAYDVDGDGYTDIVKRDWGTSKSVSRNLGNREFAELEELDGYLLTMDIDQDGLADFQLRDDESIIVSNHGSPVQVPLTKCNLFHYDFADINNDGVPDYIDNDRSVIMRIANNNTAPTAPTTLIATQTAMK